MSSPLGILREQLDQILDVVYRERHETSLPEQLCRLGFRSEPCN
jgi:hypothetical protein